MLLVDLPAASNTCLFVPRVDVVRKFLVLTTLPAAQKAGLAPTGILANVSRAAGFGSVSDLLTRVRTVSRCLSSHSGRHGLCQR